MVKIHVRIEASQCPKRHNVQCKRNGDVQVSCGEVSLRNAPNMSPMVAAQDEVKRVTKMDVSDALKHTNYFPHHSRRFAALQ